MKAFAESAVALDILRVAQPVGARFPGRRGVPDMPYIADVRGALANLNLRRLIVREMVDRVRQNFENAEMVVGLSKAGTAWGALLAWELNLPGGVVHLDGPRNSGLQRQVEGSVTGRRVLLVDNLTRSQSSVVDAARIIEAEGGAIAGAMTVVRRTVVGPEHVPAWFPVLTLCSDAELAAEGLRQGVLLPAHLDGCTDVADPIRPSSGSNSNNCNA